MREKFLIVILIIAAAATDMVPGSSAQDAAAKARQLIAQARAAPGGDRLKSLSVTGNDRRARGQMEMSGELNYSVSAKNRTTRAPEGRRRASFAAEQTVERCWAP